MIHGELVSTALKGHGAVFSAAIVVFVGFSAFSWPFKSSMEGSKKILENIRKRIIDELRRYLKAIFTGSPDVLQLGEIFGPNGERWQEEPVNLINSEDFGNALFYFVENNSETLADYNMFRIIVDRFRFWSRYFSFGLFLLMILQAVVLGLLWTVDKIFEINIPDSIIKWSVLIPVLLGINCFLGLAGLLFNNSRAIKYREIYD